MLDMPLQVGIGGNGKVARGVEFQVTHADGMELAWRHGPDDVESHLKSDPIDVFVEACGNVHDGAECSLLAIENHAHVVLTDARVDVAYGLPIQTEAHQNGIVVTSDVGTPHGTLATMIQEAHIMGFGILQAGQICPRSEPTQFLYEMAALANGFSYLPPEGGMTGSEVATPADILTSFDPDQIGDTPQIDFVRIPGAPAGLYLIVRPRHKAPAEQFDHLKPANAPYYLLHRPTPLGYLETPKTILGAAAGLPVLAPGYPTCEIYALAKKDLQTSTKLENKHLKAVLAPLDSNRVPLIHALESAQVESEISQDGNLTFKNTRIFTAR